MKENISQNMFVSYSNQAGILYNYFKKYNWIVCI